jgi:hypothetical protein
MNELRLEVTPYMITDNYGKSASNADKCGFPLTITCRIKRMTWIERVLGPQIHA